MTRRQSPRRSHTDRIDSVVLHPWLGVAAFLAVMYVMFLWTIQLGGAFIDVFDGLTGALFEQAPAEFLRGIGIPAWAVLPVEGAGRGIRTVASFIPLVLFLYAFLAFLEESGYMSRAAVVMDRFMRRIGLPGKAFVPLVVGLGCNVPAVMAARTLEDANDRKAIIAMTPFMSCGARLPVYALFAATFFPKSGENMVFALYLLGIAVAVLTGFILKRTLFAGEAQPLLIELPHYHRPHAGAVLRRAFDRVVSFVKDAGIIVVPVVMVLTLLNGITTDGRVVKSGAEPNTLLAAGSRLATPLLAPIGIAPDNWPATVGLFTGIFAKEALVGTLTALYSADGAAADAEGGPMSVSERIAKALASVPANLSGIASALLDPLGLAKSGVGAETSDQGTAQALTQRFDGAAGAFAYLVFVLLYAPCIATVAAIRRESGRSWTLFVLGWTSVMGLSVATIVYQMLTLTRHPASSLAWSAGMVALVGATPRPRQPQPPSPARRYRRHLRRLHQMWNGQTPLMPARPVAAAVGARPHSVATRLIALPQLLVLRPQFLPLRSQPGHGRLRRSVGDSDDKGTGRLGSNGHRQQVAAPSHQSGQQRRHSQHQPHRPLPHRLRRCILYAR